MKILITGICGFVGSTIAKYLKASSSGFEIFGIDNLMRSGSWLNKSDLNGIGIKVYHGDIRIQSDIDELPKADWLIDAAANASVLAGVDGTSSSLQLIQNNLMSTMNLLEYCKRHCTGFILLSTSRVYSIPDLCKIHMSIVNSAYKPVANQNFPFGVSDMGITEDYSTRSPISLYGSSKLCSEQLALEYGITYNFPVWINRCGVMAGPGQFGHPGQGIFAYWIHSFREKKALKYIGFGGKGYQVRDVLHPRDLVSLLLKQMNESLKTKKASVCNISGGITNSISIAQLTDWCNSYFDTKIVVEQCVSQRKFDIPWLVLDNKKASEIWEWEPITSFEKILEEIAQFATRNDNWIKISSF